jgi:DNA-binding NarL/FixJ family response regulator
VTAPDAARIRVLIVDDHKFLAEALSSALTAEPDMQVVGIASSVADVAASLEAPIDVVLMDYLLEDGTGAQAARIVKARQPAAAVVMLTALLDDETILESIQAGADGYLTKDRALHEVVGAVRSANAREILLPRSVIVEIARRVASARDHNLEPPSFEALTPRELDVLHALVDGLDAQSICDRLDIAPNTVRTHVQNIMGKFGTHSKLEAVAFALRHDLVDPPRMESGALRVR